MLKRAFNTKEKLNEFILKYVHKELNIKLILDILQRHHQNKYPAIKSYDDFWNPLENTKEYTAMHSLNSTVFSFLQNALEDKFGKPDFTLGNRGSRGTYILEIDGQHFILSTFQEVILESDLTSDNIDKIIRFKGQLFQLVIDYVFNNYDKLNNDVLSSYHMDSFNTLKQTNLLDSNGKINFPKSDFSLI